MSNIGFFSELEIPTIEVDPRVPLCGKCGLWEKCQSPKMEVAGKGEKQILIVGEFPGEREDANNRFFVGLNEYLLRDTLRSVGIEMYRDCWITDAIICHPTEGKITPKVIDYCRPNLLNAIKKYKPIVIILLGGIAVDSLLTYLWKKSAGGRPAKAQPGAISDRWAGQCIPSQSLNAWVIPTYHPLEVNRENRNDLKQRVFKTHLEMAASKSIRPWKVIPDYDKEVTIVMEDKTAPDYVQAFQANGEEISFDFETTSLKPDGPNAEIYCCSISDGCTTIAFPWQGRAIEAMKELLVDPNVKKSGWNARFEHRWVRRKLGVTVRGWDWDGMLAAHALDPRAGISGLKFQAFVRLGISDYSAKVSPYLKADGGNDRNKIHKADLRSVLLYCGLDSLFEYGICQMQRKEFKK